MALLYTGICVLLLAACSPPMSYEEASKSSPYKELSESDRRWLYDHHMTDGGALAWLEDEITFRDVELRVWYNSEGKLEMENEGTGKSFLIDRGKAAALVKSKGGPAVADELVASARKQTGGSAKPMTERMISKSIMKDGVKAQKLRYPKMWEDYIVYHSQEQMAKSQEAFDKGDRIKAMSFAALAHDTRRRHLGDDHPATKNSATVYTRMTGAIPATGPVERPWMF